MNWKTPDGQRMIYGYALLVILGFLAGRIALGHVEEGTSFGLPIVLNTIGILAGGFTQWAFGASRDSSKDKSDDEEKK